MKFINYLESISGVSVYPMASLFIYFFFFLGLSIWAFRADRGYINKVKNIPLAEEK